MRFCEYKDIFGKENEGVHSYKIGGIAMFDFIGTFVLAFIFSKLFNASYFLVLIILFILSIYLHYLFCVETTTNKFLYDLIKNK